MRTSTFCEVARPAALYCPTSSPPKLKHPLFPALSTPSHAVGYNNNDLINGNKAVGLSFVTIGNEGCKLSTIKPNGLTSGNTSKLLLQLLNGAGITTNSFSYYYGSKKKGFTTEGWYTKTGALITSDNDYVFNPGQGVWINCLLDNVTLTCSGEVIFGDVTCPLINGNVMIANPYALDLKLSNITPSSNLVGGNTSKLLLQQLNGAGITTNSFSYYKGSKKKGFTTEGWYTKTGTLITSENDYTFAPGAGLWINCLADSISLTLQSGQSAE